MNFFKNPVRRCFLMRLFRRSFSSSLTSALQITQLCSNGRLQEALLEMALLGPEIGFHGYDALLNACLAKRAYRGGQRVHAHMIKTRYRPATYLRTRLLVFYGKCDFLEDARKVLDEMPEKNVISWTAMISRYSQTGHCLEALGVFAEMMRSDGKPNEYTFASVLTSCVRASFGLGLGKQIHGLVIRWGYDSYIFVGSSLLDMYAKAGEIEEARRIFECLSERDVVSCTAIIAGYAQLGLDEEALEMFRRLQSEGMTPNYVTYASVLTALSGLALLNHGKQAHCHVLRCELLDYTVLQNSLIDMYSKCGNLSYARRLFDKMPERTTISWNAMLVGYSKHGLGKEVLELFRLMRVEKSVKPDSVTLLAVLSGCSHGKMEDTGLSIFDGMIAGDYGVKPDTEHYGCIVDMLGRAGRIGEAFEFVKRMPSEPTAGVLGSLLGACRIHSSVDIGESVGRKLIEIEPENAGNYVILSNLYASAGRWQDVNNLRALMMQKAVTKEPGRSWIQHDQTVHYFHANDRTHPRREEVLAKLKDILIKMKQAGYVPDLSCVLYDVDEEQKEKMLLGHSEKLALTFGLIATGDGIPIKVFKNLRICTDCHNFAKIFSKVFEREVSLRDKNRFHQIVGGVCSCGDYW